MIKSKLKRSNNCLNIISFVAYYALTSWLTKFFNKVYAIEDNNWCINLYEMSSGGWWTTKFKNAEWIKSILLHTHTHTWIVIILSHKIIRFSIVTSLSVMHTSSIDCTDTLYLRKRNKKKKKEVRAGLRIILKIYKMYPRHWIRSRPQKEKRSGALSTRFLFGSLFYSRKTQMKCVCI